MSELGDGFFWHPYKTKGKPDPGPTEIPEDVMREISPGLFRDGERIRVIIYYSTSDQIPDWYDELIDELVYVEPDTPRSNPLWHELEGFWDKEEDS